MINVAVLGAGVGSQHIAAFQALSDLYRIELIVENDPSRAQQLAAETGVPVSADIEDAFGEAIDLVDICLPPSMHADVTIRALQHGKHVICEKPLATSMADVKQIEVAAQKHHRQVFPVFQYRWGKSVSLLGKMVSSGIAGRPIVASVETHWSRGHDYYAAPWRGTWDGEQGGAVLSHAIHMHDLLSFFMGPISAVSAFATTRVNEIETEDCAAIAFQFANGALATSSITLGAATNETRLRFVFEHVTATSGQNPYAPGEGTWTFEARDPSRQHQFDRIASQSHKDDSGFVGFFKEIAKGLHGSPNNAVRLDEGAASIELVTAIYDAARNGTRVSLPLPNTHPLFKSWRP